MARRIVELEGTGVYSVGKTHDTHEARSDPTPSSLISFSGIKPGQTFEDDLEGAKFITSVSYGFVIVPSICM